MWFSKKKNELKEREVEALEEANRLKREEVRAVQNQNRMNEQASAETAAAISAA